VLKSRSVESNVRSVDVQFVMNMHAFVQKIDFCAVIYDECPRDRDAYPAGAGG
jgi:hypothetical protein